MVSTVLVIRGYPAFIAGVACRSGTQCYVRAWSLWITLIHFGCGGCAVVGDDANSRSCELEEISLGDDGNESREVRTSGNTRPTVNAAATFCKSTPTLIVFSLVEAIVESRLFKATSSFDATFWRATLRSTLGHHVGHMNSN